MSDVKAIIEALHAYEDTQTLQSEAGNFTIDTEALKRVRDKLDDIEGRSVAFGFAGCLTARSKEEAAAIAEMILPITEAAQSAIAEINTLIGEG